MNFWKRFKPNHERGNDVHRAEMLDVYTRWLKGEKLSRKHRQVLKACQESAELEPLRELADFAHYQFQQTEGIQPRPGAKERIANAVMRSVNRQLPESESWSMDGVALEPVYSPEQVGSDSELAYSPTPGASPIPSGADISLDETIVVEPENSDASNIPSPTVRNHSLKLKVTQGDQVGSEFNLVFAQMTIGRGADSTIHLKNNASASRSHAVLSIENEELYITDLDSSNGTYVDEQRISSPTPIYLASQIIIGDQVLQVTELRREDDAFHVTFKVVAGADIGQPYTVSVREITVGRGTTTTLRLSDSTGRLSRRHAGFELTNGDIHLRDLGSTNGTYVDGTRIEAPTRINVGAVIKLGGISCEVIAIEHS